MKKIDFSFIVTIFIMMFGFLLFSCQKTNQLTSLNWSEGDSAKNQKIISEIKTETKPSEIIYKNNRILINEQTYENKKIQNTFVKKNLDQNSNLKSAEAQFYNINNLQSKLLLKATSITKLSNEQILNKISTTTADKKIKNISSENIFLMNHGQLESLIAVDYEVADGTVWQALIDKKFEVISNRRQGSGYTETLANIYPMGPVQSHLTETLLKGLDPLSLLVNQSIFVDNESNKKIAAILPEMKYDPKDERFDQLQVFYYLDQAQKWMQTHLSVRFPEKLFAVVNVGYPEKTNTAFYYKNKIRLGRGDDVTYSSIASDPSIVYHESFHALIDGLARLPFEGEGGSLNEAFADFFTCIALKRPFLGEASYLKATYKRSLLTVIKLEEKSGGLYHDSLIVSGLLWAISEKIGPDKSLKVAIETLSRLNPVSTISDFNTHFLKVIHSELSAEDVEVVTGLLKSRGFANE